MPNYQWEAPHPQLTATKDPPSTLCPRQPTYSETRPIHWPLGVSGAAVHWTEQHEDAGLEAGGRNEKGLVQRAHQYLGLACLLYGFGPGVG